MEAVNAATDHQTGDLLVYTRTEGGQVQRRVVKGECVNYVAKKDATRDLLRALRASRHVRSISAEGDAWVRVVWRTRQARDVACHPSDGWFAKQNVKTYEGDVPALRRWMIDHKVSIQRPRRVYLDIETCGRVPFARKEESRILCWTLCVEGDVHRARVVAQGVLERDDDAAEAVLMKQLWAALGDYDQVLAWNGDEFDFPVVFARTQKAHLAVDVRRWLWLDHLVLFRRMNVAGAESGEEKQSMSLEAVSQAVLREGKSEGVTYDKLFPWWAAGGRLRQQVLDYNARDTELMARIEQKTGYVELQHTLCEVCGVFCDSQGIQPMPQVESYMLRLGKEQGVHFVTRERDFTEEAGFKGAFVMDPTARGIVKDVHVADFSSMYPSVILSFNMSPDTLKVDEDEEDDWLTSLAKQGPSYLRSAKPAAPLGPDPIPEGCARAPLTGALFKQEKRGILPLALEQLLAMRKHWSAAQAALPPGTSEWVDAGRRSTAYKIAANSFYGVVGARISRLYDHAVAESVSQGGVWLIRETIKAAQAQPWGLSVIYGDTDSIFVVGCTAERFEQFVAWCNAELYPRILREQGCTRNTVKIAYEKAFDRIVFVSAKRYAGRYAHYKGKAATEESKPEIKGLEYKRGDAVRLARRLQAEVVDLLLGGGVDVPGGLGEPGRKAPREERCEESPDAFKALVEGYQKRILEGTLELTDVVLSKRLSRPLKEYASKLKKDGTEGAQPPHIRVAKMLAERGRPVTPGTRIEYVVTDGLAKPAAVIPGEDWAGECDRCELWEALVWPPTERLLAAAFPGALWGSYGRVRARGPRGRKTALATLPGGVQGVLAPSAGSALPAAPEPPRTDNAPQGVLFSLSEMGNAPWIGGRPPKRGRR